MIEKIRKIGIITKGVVYSLVGILTLLAAFNVGGKVAGKNAVIAFLQDQAFGNFILVVLATGLFGYAIWRLYSAFQDAKNEGSDKIGYAKRTGYFFSGLTYALLGFSTLTAAFGNSGGGNNSQQDMAASLLDQSYGQALLFALAAILLGVGIYQFYKGFSKKFLEDIDQQGQVESREALEKSGMFGFIARGFSFGIIAWFVFKAAAENNAGAIRGLEGMFAFLQEMQWGNILMGVMALGLLAYGVYQYFLARYSRIYSNT